MPGHADCQCPKCKTEFQDIVAYEDCDECGSLPNASVAFDCPICHVPLRVSRVVSAPIYKISALRV